MVLSSSDIVKFHIEEYLKTGNEKLDNAKLLRKAKKYSGAITSYIDAYEEIGQAVFLADKLSNSEEISEEDWNKYIKPASHPNKILAHWITRKVNFNKATDADFEKMQKSKIGKSFFIPDTRQDALKKIEERISIFSKLHKLRQKFDYSHDLDGQIANHEYDKQVLESLCHLLECECYASYCVVRFMLEVSVITPLDDVDELLSKIASLPTAKKLKKLNQDYGTPSNMDLRNEGIAIHKVVLT